MSIPRRQTQRCCSGPPFTGSILSTCKLLIFLLALSGRTQVQAQRDNSQCHNDLYSADQNGDGMVNGAEYVEFCRLRLEDRLSIYPDGHVYDISSAPIQSFVSLPPSLQSNFYLLACLCSRYNFDDIFADKSKCCVGDNAHLSVVPSIDSEVMNAEELEYSSRVCAFTNRVVDQVILTLDKLPTAEPTNKPTSLPPTLSPTERPSIRTSEPTATPTATPTVAPTMKATSATSLPKNDTAVDPTVVTVITSYSILVEEKDLAVNSLNDIYDDSVRAMDVVASEVMYELWMESDQSPDSSVFADKISAMPPTSIEKLFEVGFTSNPNLVEMPSETEDKLLKVFAGGPCPIAMEAGENDIKYDCFEVRSEIPLRVYLDDELMEAGITLDDAKNYYLEALEKQILGGKLADVHEEFVVNSSVIVATGQIVSEDVVVTPPTKGRNGIIVGVVTGVLILVLILLWYFLRRRKRIQSGDDKDTVANPDEDPEAKFSPEKKSSQGTALQWQQHRSPNKTVPYFGDSSPRSVPSGDDGKSIISAESEAGWSDVYTNSMGSVSDDGLTLDSPPSKPSSPAGLMSLSAGPTSIPIETETSSASSPVKQSQIPVVASPITPNKPTSLDGQSSTTAVSPITPKSIQVLDGTTSDNDDEFMVHEDFSDEEDGGKSPKQSQKKESPETFRAKIKEMIERIVPEEIDQLDQMIAEFKGREDELVNTLLAMEKRTLAQWRSKKPKSTEEGSELT